MNIILVITLATMITTIVYSINISILKIHFSLYWIVSLVGSLILLSLDPTLFPFYLERLFIDSSINPIKILVLFLSFTAISIYLDEIGLISFLASKTALIAGRDQKKLFFYFYVLISFLTIFTANDIVILTLTPFIIYFSKNVKINPLPFVIMQFVAANTWSMLLVIGNPTNIYLATTFDIDFLEYAQVMFIPTVATGLLSYLLLYALFHRSLNHTMAFHSLTVKPNTILSMIGIIHLVSATLLIALAPYLNYEMYLITLMVFISLMIMHVFTIVLFKLKDTYILKVIKRIPWSLIPFFLSMVFLISVMDLLGWTLWLNQWLVSTHQNWIVGLTSFLISNIINNIPMSILYSKVLTIGQFSSNIYRVYASIIGSNLAAILTPIGALAGMMWLNILKKFEIKLHFFDFLRYGFIIGFPLLAISLFALDWIV